MKLVKKKYINYTGKVYDLGVNTPDHSYTINNTVVHNSAGGSVCSYFLDLIYLDPLEFDLLFERFLNEGRIGKSYPDIDSDFPGLRREEVKKYMEHRYGKEYVCSVGTYSLLQLRASIKDIAKQYGVSFEEVNSVTLKLDIKDKTLNDLFQKAKEYKTISTFIKNHPNVINDVSEIIGQPKSASVHACATIIFPSHKNMFQSVPVRDQNNIIVSEWEGGELEMAGYLKEDILGIKQLDKFARIIELIKIETGKHVNIYKIPYDDQEVFKYFKKGWNGDVFHFGSHGLTGYCKELKPKNLDMLIAAISLYRPGAMENNFHNEYVFRMRGEKEIDYIPGLKEVTKETYGLMIYQEQIMKAVSVIADFNLVDADSIRKAMGHHKVELLLSFKQQFINGGIKNGYEEDSLKDTWEMLAKFAGYSFNKSHAAAYAITGYICQWFKVHYPMQYWMAAFEFTEEKKIPEFISEIYHTGGIRIIGSDINNSYLELKANYQSKKLFWSLLTIKMVGEKAVQQIVDDKEKNGDYFDFEEFYVRNKFKGSKVNKRVIENLILSGAFDGIERISEARGRYRLIEKYRELSRAKIDSDKDLFELNTNRLEQNSWWQVQQKLVSSLAFLDYEHLCSNMLKFGTYIDSEDFNSMDGKTQAKIGGFVVDIIEKRNKKGKWCSLVLESNYTFINVTIWSDIYDMLKTKLKGCKKKCILISGIINYDRYKKCNTLYGNKKSEVIIL